METLFLTHNPHESHLNFARTINARVKKIPFNNFIDLAKKYPFLNNFYPIISYFYSLTIKLNEKYILVDGGSSLYAARFLKNRKPKLRIIYLDGDLFILSMHNQEIKKNKFKKFFLEGIDANISVSEMNKEVASEFLKVPIEVCSPYPKKVKKSNVKRENYGLYIGRLDPDKNIKRIVQFGLQCPLFDKFIVVGDGVYRDWIIKKSKRNKKLQYMGVKNNVQYYYNKCKFLIHIPDLDPYPCTTMEAAICGCFPIISAGVGTNSSFDKALIIDDPNDFKMINNRIEYILKNEKRIRGKIFQSIKKIPNKKNSISNFKTIFNEIVNKIR